MPRVRQSQQALAGLASRRDALRQAAGIAGADFAALLDAALAELDGIIGDIAAGDAVADGGDPAGDAAPARAERLLLHAAFQQAPVPLFLLEQDGTIRRANVRAAELLGVPVGYATGRTLTAFLDVPSRAAVRSQLAALARTAGPRRTTGRVLTPSGPVGAVLTATAVDLPGEEPLVIVAATVQAVTAEAAPGTPAERPGHAPAPVPGETTSSGHHADHGGGEDLKRGTAPGDLGGHGDPAGADTAIRAMTRRLDLVTEVTRVLLDNAAFSEAVTIRRCARLLAGAGALADWVIVDLDREGRLRRQTVVGPGGAGEGAGDGDRAAAVRDTDPAAESVPGRVHDTGSPVLLAHAADDALLGAGPDGSPLLPALGVTSLICVPVRYDDVRYGTLTLGRLPDAWPYLLSDLALAERLGSHLGAAIGVSRRFRERSQAAQAMQASLLPARLPVAEGLEFAAAYLAATGWQETGADFYDAFAVAGGWAVAVGDVSGRGQDAAAMTAATRHAIRALTVTRAEPGPGQQPPHPVRALTADAGAGPGPGQRPPARPAAPAPSSTSGSASRRRRSGPAKSPSAGSSPAGSALAGSAPAGSASAGSAPVGSALPSPAEVLAAVNDVLLAGEYDDRYVTVRLAFLRREGDRVRVALGGAGHPGPAVLRADGRVEVLGAAGRPLGLFAELGPDSRELELAPGDLLLFYTDGAVSARGADLAAFEERLADQLAALAGHAAPEVIRAAQALATDFARDELRDDLTLLAVRAVLAGRALVQQPVPQVGERAGHQPGDVHLRDAESLADLGLGEIPVEPHGEDVLLALGQLAPVRLDRGQVDRPFHRLVVGAEQIAQQRRIVAVGDGGVE